MNPNAKVCKTGPRGEVNSETSHCHVCGRETWHKCRTVGCGKLVCQLDSVSYEEEDDENMRHCKNHRAEATESSQSSQGSQGSSYIGCVGEQPVMEDSLPVLPIGGREVNLLEAMILENGGIENFDKIRTWNEIETVRKHSKKKKIHDSDIEGG